MNWLRRLVRWLRPVLPPEPDFDPEAYQAIQHWVLKDFIGLAVVRRCNNQTWYPQGSTVCVLMHEISAQHDFEAGCAIEAGDPVWLGRDGKVYNDRRMLEKIV